MIKPYNDESEWMALKILVGISGDIVKIKKEEMNRLIATIDHKNKVLLDQCKLHTRIIKENERLKAELEGLKEILKTINKHGQ